MRARSAVLILMSIVALLLALGLQGCLFGGGGGEESAGAPPPGEAGAPPGEMGAPPGEMGAPPPEGEMGAPPMEGEMGAPPPEGGEMAGMPAEGGEMGAMDGAGGDAGAMAQDGLTLKHEGNYTAAKQKFEAAIAADPNNLVAHNGLAWILAEMADATGDAGLKAQAVAEFNKVIELGASGEMAAEAQAALQRLG